MTTPDNTDDFPRTTPWVDGPVLTDEQIREAQVAGETGGRILVDSAQTAGKEVTDYGNSQVQAAKDASTGLGNAAEDYGHGWSRAFDDASHGNVLGAGADVLGGEFKATVDVVEGAAKAVGDTVEGAFKVGEDAVEGAEEVGHDALTGAKHFLGIGGDDKAGVMAKVGQEDAETLKANADEENRGRQQLQTDKSEIAAKNPGSFSTADQLLDPGSAGMHFFDYWLPAYDEWTGQHITIDEIRQAYDRERGMSFAAYAADAKSLIAAQTSTQGITTELESTYNTLIPTWQGDAASQFESAMKTFFTGDATVSKDLGDAGKTIDELVVALQQLVYTKACTVSGLYTDELPPGIQGIQALQALIPVARNSGCDDEMRRWVLGVFHMEMHGRHAWDDDNDQYSSDKLDDNTRAAATQVAGEWLNQVLVPQFEARYNAFQDICARTTDGIRRLFAQFTGDLKSVKDPFAGMSSSAPTDDSPTQDGSTGGGSTGGGGGSTGGGSTGGGGTGGGGTGGGGTGGGTGGGGTGGGSSDTTTPAVVTPATPANGGIPPAGSIAGGTGAGATGAGGTGIDPSGTFGGVTPTGSGVTDDGADPAPKTNPDGSVTFGKNGDLKIGKENPDGSFDVTETGADGQTHDYKVVFGPNGKPVVTEVGGVHGTNTTGAGAGTDGAAAFGSIGAGSGSGAASSDSGGTVGAPDFGATSTAGITTNPDGSVSFGADHDLKIGSDTGGEGFTLTQGSGASAQPYQVSYDGSGAPHVSAPDFGTSGVGAGGTHAVSTPHIPDLSTDSVSPQSHLHEATFHSGGSAGGSGSGGGGSVGAADFGGGAGSGAGTAGGDAGAAAAAHDATATQLGVGNQFGAQNAGDGTSAAGLAASTDGGAAAGTAGAGAAGHAGVGGMPMMGGMGGMGGRGGNEQEIKRRYGQKEESVLEDGELEEWDRLGPTIG